MSKRVANTRERTARNGRVRLGHWKKQKRMKRPEPVPDFTAPPETPKPQTMMDKVRRVFRHQKRGS